MVIVVRRVCFSKRIYSLHIQATVKVVHSFPLTERQVTVKIFKLKYFVIK